MIASLARLPLARLVRAPRAWIPIGLWIALAVVAAAIARSRLLPHGADRALLGPFAAVAAPLLAYAVVSAVMAGDRLGRATRPLVDVGAPPVRVALVHVVVAVVASAMVVSVLGAVVDGIAHGASDPPLAKDMLTAWWASFLGGAAYGALFAFGSSFGPRGVGRTVALVVDWVIGAASGSLALLFPRAHLRNLLGGDAPLAIGQRASVGWLLLIALFFAALAVLRGRKAA